MPLMAKILIVEDQNIVAMDIQNRLKSLNYIVTGTASSGAGAVKKAGETSPDLVLMDIMLKGDMDGVQAAEEIRYRFGIPVVYLTAYADINTLQRAKITEPFGYILKPFQERELHSTIEMALYKHKVEQEVKERESLFSTTLKAINDGIIITDKKSCVTFINPKGEVITELNYRNAIKEKVENVIKASIITEKLDEASLEIFASNKKFNFLKISSRSVKQSEIWLKVEKIFNEDSEFVGYVISFNNKSSFNNYQTNIDVDMESLSHKINNLLTSITINLSLLQDYKDKDPMFNQLLLESEKAAFKISETLKEVNN